MKKYLFIFCVLFYTAPLFSRVSVALFPLHSESAHPHTQWIGYTTPDLLFRTLYKYTDIQVWDPVFLVSVDSVYFPEGADSLLNAHAQRWNWTIAVGGGFSVSDDSVAFRVRVSVRNENAFEHNMYEIRAKIESCVEAQAELIATIIHDYKLGHDDHKTISEQLRTLGAPHAYSTYVAGYRYEMQGNYTAALSAYLHALGIDGSFAPAYYRCGILYERARKQDRALEAYRQAVSYAPQSPLYMSALSEFLTVYDLAESEELTHKHTQLLSSSAEGLRAMGLLHMANGSYQRAISLLTRAIAAGPCDLESDFLLGKAYMTAGQHGMASEVFGRLVNFRPFHIRYYAFQGAAYRKAGQLMESTNVLQAALRIEPDNEYTLTHLAHTYFLLKWYEQAEQLLIRARKKNPHLSELLVNLGVIYLRTGRSKQAQRLFRQAAAFPTTAQAALNNEANLLFLSGNVKKAIKKYRKAGEVRGINESVLHNLGMAYVALGKNAEAYACFEDVLRLVPHRIDVLETQAIVAQRLNKKQEAERIYRQLLHADPRNRSVRLKCISLLSKQSHYEQAIELIEEYLKEFPHDRQFRLLLPSIYHQMQWFEVAVEDYKRLVDDPQFSDSYEAFYRLGKSMYDCMRIKDNCKDPNRAIFFLKQAAEINPARAEPDIIIGHLYRDYRNHRSLAVEHWRRALEKSTDRETKKRIQALLTEAGR